MATTQLLPDIPEPLFVDCLAFSLDPDTAGLRPEAQICSLGLLFGRDFSEALLLEEVAWMSVGQVVQLLGSLDTLLQGMELGGTECEEVPLLAWVGVQLPGYGGRGAGDRREHAAAASRQSHAGTHHHQHEYSDH